MLSQNDVKTMQDRLFGSTEDSGAIETVRRQIRDKLKELKELNRKMDELAFSGTERIDCGSAVETLKKSSPYLDISFDDGNMYREGSGREAVLFAKVDGAPFHIFNRLGVAQFTTLPINDIGVKFNSHAILGVYFRPTYWKRHLRGVLRSDNVPLAKYEYVVSGARKFGHPHFRNEFSLSDDGTELHSNYEMCLGNNDMELLLRDMNSPAKLMLLLRCLHAWMTEINLGSMFSINATPVNLCDDYYTDVLVPACVSIRPKLIEFVKSSEYEDFVKRARRGEVLAMTEFSARQLDFIESVVEPITAIAGESVAMFRKLMDAGYMKHGVLAVALHQFLSAIGALSTRRGVHSQVDRAAYAVLLLGGSVWADGQLSCHLMNLGTLNRRAVNLYLGDYEVMRDGTYTT